MQFELCEWRESLADSLVESANDARIGRYMRNGFPYPYTPADARAFIAAARACGEDHKNRAIVADGRAVGGIGLTRLGDVYRKSAEIGYWLTPACWGKGIMTEAVGQMCAMGFADMDIVRIFAEVFAPNLASQRVLEKCSFALEGRKRKSVYKGGAFCDSVVYALVKD